MDSNDSFEGFDLQTFLYLKQMREEAQALYDYCLVEGNPDALLHFLEEQIALDPPPVLLLHEIFDDIQHRFMTLRENHFDVRNEIVRALRELYHADVSRLLPADHMESYHLVKAEDILQGMAEQGIEVGLDERRLLTKLIKKSADTASRLQRDIIMTESLQMMVRDWLNALMVVVARDYQPSWDAPPPHHLH